MGRSALVPKQIIYWFIPRPSTPEGAFPTVPIFHNAELRCIFPQVRCVRAGSDGKESIHHPAGAIKAIMELTGELKALAGLQPHLCFLNHDGEVVQPVSGERQVTWSCRLSDFQLSLHHCVASPRKFPVSHLHSKGLAHKTLQKDPSTPPKVPGRLRTSMQIISCAR